MNALQVRLKPHLVQTSFEMSFPWTQLDMLRSHTKTVEMGVLGALRTGTYYKAIQLNRFPSREGFIRNGDNYVLCTEISAG